MPVEAEGYTINAVCDDCGDYETFYGKTKGDAERHAESLGWKMGRRDALGKRPAACRGCLLRRLAARLGFDAGRRASRAGKERPLSEGCPDGGGGWAGCRPNEDGDCSWPECVAQEPARQRRVANDRDQQESQESESS